MLKQRLCGLCLLLISVLVIALAVTGRAPADRDGTALLFLVPGGLYLCCTKERVM